MTKEELIDDLSYKIKTIEEILYYENNGCRCEEIYEYEKEELGSSWSFSHHKRCPYYMDKDEYMNDIILLTAKLTLMNSKSEVK